MQALVVVLILVAAAINLAPLVGVLSVDRMRALYGIPLEGDVLLILMRHRALLFGIVGGLLVASVFQPSLRPVATVAGLLSMLSFVAIVWLQGGANSELQRVAAADLVGSAALVAAALLDRLWQQS